MRGVLSIVTICVLWTHPALAGLGTLLTTTPTPTTTTNGNGEDNSNDEYLNKLDSEYNDNLSNVNSNYEASTNAINDGSYENYNSRLDSTLEAMYEDINNGGTAKGMETAGSYTAPTIPGSEGSGDGNGESTSTSATNTSASTTNSDSNNGGETEEEAPSDPRVAAVLEACTPACTPEGGEFDQACASNCARQVLGVAPEPSATDNLMLMSLLGN